MAATGTLAVAAAVVVLTIAASAMVAVHRRLSRAARIRSCCQPGRLCPPKGYSTCSKMPRWPALPPGAGERPVAGCAAAPPGTRHIGAARHRSSGASLLRRLQAATARNRELAQDNQRLRHQLAQALGQLRAAAMPGERRD